MNQPNPFWLSQAIETDHPRRYVDPDSGIRFYPIEVHHRWLAVPGVTSLLGCLDSKEDREFLLRWRDKEIAAGRNPDAGRERGTRVHAAIETFIRSGNPGDLAPEDLAFFEGMEEHLGRYDRFLWNERPLLQGWEQCWSAPPGDPDRLARVMSATWGFAGTPDLIGERRGLTILGDFKTSTKPYFRCSGERVPAHHAVGFKKYRKTVRQLICYTIAVEEMFDIHIDALQIMVALPKAGDSQSFLIDRRSVEFERELEIVKRASVQFWREFGDRRSAAATPPPALQAAAAA